MLGFVKSFFLARSIFLEGCFAMFGLLGYNVYKLISKSPQHWLSRIWRAEKRRHSPAIDLSENSFILEVN